MLDDSHYDKLFALLLDDEMELVKAITELNVRLPIGEDGYSLN